MALIEEWTSVRSARDCEQTLAAAGVPCSRYQTVGEAIADPQIAERRLMARIPNAAGGFLVPNPPFQFADGSVGIVPRAPRLGEHNGEFLDPPVQPGMVGD